MNVPGHGDLAGDGEWGVGLSASQEEALDADAALGGAGGLEDDGFLPQCGLCQFEIHDPLDRKCVEDAWFHKRACYGGSVWFTRWAARMKLEGKWTAFRTAYPEIANYMLYDLITCCTAVTGELGAAGHQKRGNVERTLAQHLIDSARNIMAVVMIPNSPGD